MNKTYRIENLILIIFLIFAASMFILFGIGFGPIFLTGLLIYISAWLYIRRISITHPGKKYVKAVKHLMLALFVVWLSSFLWVEGLVIANDKADANVKGDYMLVLGAGLRGETPSISLKSRLDKAAQYLILDKEIKVIVSGGQGDGESITEAEAMKRYLVQAGIDEARIIKEDKSTSTKENLLYSKKILDNLWQRSNHKLILITSDFHIFRTKLLAERAGLDISVLPADTPFTIYLNYAIREYFAVIKMYLD